MKQVIEIIGKTLSIDPSRITAESHLVDHLGADDFDTLEVCEAMMLLHSSVRAQNVLLI